MPPAEVAVLLDSTNSIKRANWPVVIQFVKNIADKVNYGPSEVGDYLLFVESRFLIKFGSHYQTLLIFY